MLEMLVAADQFTVFTVECHFLTRQFLLKQLNLHFLTLNLLLM